MSIGDAARSVGTSIGRLRRLADAGVVTSHTTPGGHRRFDRKTLEREWSAQLTRSEPTDSTSAWSRRYVLDGLREDAVWSDVRAAIESRSNLPEPARRVLAYAVSEMVNNAIDHSRGSVVTATLRITDRTIELQIEDDGVGAFRNLSTILNLPDDGAAVVEITKGKRTTDPARHSGEGIFFTSKAVDVFGIEANGYRLVLDNIIGDVAFGQGTRAGTTIELRLDIETETSLADLFESYTDDALAFTRTTPRIELVTVEGEFISRSEAKRFAAGLEKFTRVELDFTGVDLIGQGFADELFRVWHREHPDIELLVVGAGRGVRLMIDRVRLDD